ncbi:MAG TPA: VOC family protein [Myxococcota bacterium]|nr:VOC family protein [Myxococcota bacterium]
MRTQIVTPYLCCRDAARALDFYERAFGAQISERYVTPEGVVGHAELEVAGGRFMLSDEWPSERVYSPAQYGGTPCSIRLVVPDVDGLAARAVAAGGTLERPVADQPHGDRSCVLRDPFGHRWFLATRIEEVSREELRRRLGGRFEVT